MKKQQVCLTQLFLESHAVKHCSFSLSYPYCIWIYSLNGHRLAEVGRRVCVRVGGGGGVQYVHASIRDRSMSGELYINYASMLFIQ